LAGAVWVVDNGSTDGSADMAAGRFPDAQVIANDHNPGFAAANNQALQEMGFG
jgi:GT2 family glycosyltransferase